MGKYNVFSARVDNPNREQSAKTGTIKHIDILNLDEVTVDFNANLYASYTDISYGKTYEPDKDEDEYLHVIDKSQREQMLDMHRLEKAYEVATLLPDKASAELKGRLILEDFAELRPVINGIKLFGLDWFDLRVYDILTIDFFIEGMEIDLVPRHIVRLMAQINNERDKREVGMFAKQREMVVLQAPEKKIYKHRRKFMGTLRCKVMHREIDPNTGVITINVRQQDASALLLSL
jgi:hypothetical protein